MYYFLIFVIMLMMIGIVAAIVEGKIIFSKIMHKKIFKIVYLTIFIVSIFVFSLFYYHPQDINQDLTQYNREYSNEALLLIYSNAQARGIYIDRMNPNRMNPKMKK